MANQRVTAPLDRAKVCDYNWESFNASAIELMNKSKLIAKNLPGELAEAAKESVAERVNLLRIRMMRRLVL